MRAATRTLRAMRATRATRADAVLGYATWGIILIAFGAALVASRHPLEALLRTVPTATRRPVDLAMPIFFALLIARLVLHVLTEASRRVALLLLTFAIGLWGGTGLITAVTQGAALATTFPSVGDVLFLSGVVSVATFLVLDRRRAQEVSTAGWLDIAIASGGAVSVASLTLATPLVQAMSHTVPVFPLLYLGLIAIVAGQVLRGTRPAWPNATLVVAGFTCMIVADTVLYRQIAGGRREYGLGLDLLWALAVVLIVTAACRPTPPPTRTARRPGPEGARVRSWLREPGIIVTLSTLTAAVLLLAFLPPGTIRYLALGPALLSLAAAGVRLALALRAARDATEAVERSLTDDVTGLPNRRGVARHLDEAMDAGADVGLVLLDLKGFAEVNDTLGHTAGDTLLQTVGSRLRTESAAEVLVGRLGGDEYCLVYPDGDPTRLGAIAQLLRHIVRRPAQIEGISMTLDAAIGIAVPDDATRGSGDLLRRADIALAQAKADHVPYRVYDPERDEYTRSRLELGAELRQGVVRDQLELWYQPQVDLRTGHVTSVEALVRWRHPRRGLVPPGEFLGLARRFGLMPAITESTLRLAVAEAARWQTAGLNLQVAVNVAPAELLSGGLMDLLCELVPAAGIPGELIVIEVTEESFLADRDRATEVIQQLHAAGIGVSIDDYGTGFSSLAYLRDLPLTELKIDRLFVSEVDTDPRSTAIVSTTIALAHALGLRIVAEGVETASVCAALRALGVDLIQGFHIARPLPASEVAPWIAAYDPLLIAGRVEAAGASTGAPAGGSAGSGHPEVGRQGHRDGAEQR